MSTAKNNWGNFLDFFRTNQTDQSDTKESFGRTANGVVVWKGFIEKGIFFQFFEKCSKIEFVCFSCLWLCDVFFSWDMITGSLDLLSCLEIERFGQNFASFQQCFVERVFFRWKFCQKCLILTFCNVWKGFFRLKVIDLSRIRSWLSNVQQDYRGESKLGNVKF